MIPFNKPSIVGRELDYIQDSVASGRTSGDGKYTFLAQQFLEKTFGYPKVLLTTSCTDALEIAASALELTPDDEVILPSFAFVSLATAFTSTGVSIKFADIDASTGNIALESIKAKITTKTKAIVVIHYAGVACDMDALLELCNKHNIVLIEDVALAFDGNYKGKPLGSFGSMATMSFHETKNISCGEGGALIINDSQLIEKAEIIRDKGTNRAQLRRGEVQKYEWLSKGSSHLASDISAAFLYGQLEQYPQIQSRRIALWDKYIQELKALEKYGVSFQAIPTYGYVNGSSFHMICNSETERNGLIDHLANEKVKAVFHYLPLHLSPYYLQTHGEEYLPHTEKLASTILRLPLYFSLSNTEQDKIIESILRFYREQ